MPGASALGIFGENMTYPKWLYNAQGSVLLRSAQEEDALVGEWFDSPAKVSGEESPKEIVQAANGLINDEDNVIIDDDPEYNDPETAPKRRGRPPRKV